MTLEEAEELALSVLKQVMEEKISTENVELARVTAEKGYHSATVDEVGAVLDRL
jgi:20S proteasome subunit alpha 5